MSRRPGSHRGLLDELHAQGCENGTEYSACRPVVVPEGANREPTYADHERGATIEVVFMVWCSDCGAADYEVV